MHPHARHLPAPVLGASVAVVEVPKVFSGKEITAHVLHHPLHPGLSFGQRMRVGSIANPRAWAYSRNAS
jgi:hypothetical protein